MREMKDSGMIRLKYVVDIFGRIGFRGYTEQDLVDENEGAITLSPSNIQNMKMDYSKCSFLTWQKYYESPEIKIKNGDVLFVKTGSTYGKVGYVENLPMEATINPQLVVFKNISMNSKLLFYMLQISFVKDQCELAVVGGTIPTMSQVKIGNIYIPFPSLAEQQKIAEFLDRECGKIDGLKADIQAQIDTLEQYKRSVITEAVTHGLNPSAPMKDSGIPWVGKTPEYWKVGRIGGLYELRNQKVSDKDFMPLSVTMKGILPQLETAAKTNDGDNRKLVRVGDFAINSRSDRRGSCGISDYDGSVSLINTILKARNRMNAKYYNWLFHTPMFADEFYKWGHGIVDDLWTTNWSEMKRISIPLPPLDEQQEIADYLDNKCAEIEQIIADKKSQIETLDGYKKSLIYEYVTGKKEVV